jgi:FkbM family methyltransferase
MRNVFSRNPKSAYSAEQVQVAEFEFYESSLQRGMTIFDVGSNIGTTAEYFVRKVGVDGVVHCFEPGEHAYLKLRQLLEGTNVATVKLNNVAVGDRAGTTSFHVYPESHSSWNSVGRRPLEKYGIALRPEKIVEVPQITLDNYCTEHHVKHIDLLKLDLEGCELQALRGARRLLEARRVTMCIMEFGQTTFDQHNTPHDIASFWQSVGYHLRNLVPGDPLFPGGKSAETAQFAMLLAARPKTG